MERVNKAELLSMSTNERLFVSGFLEDFDDAMSRGDKETARRLLELVYVDELSIVKILAKDI